MRDERFEGRTQDIDPRTTSLQQVVASGVPRPDAYELAPWAQRPEPAPGSGTSRPVYIRPTDGPRARTLTRRRTTHCWRGQHDDIVHVLYPGLDVVVLIDLVFAAIQHPDASSRSGRAPVHSAERDDDRGAITPVTFALIGDLPRA